MRQLLATGWMHNRVRMIVASFLVKDLHLPWQWGARHFMAHLVDGDLASNSHGWQWTAGTGTDAAPYFRIFNPVSQAERFDPDGDVHPPLGARAGPRRTVGDVHAPWRSKRGLPLGDQPADGRPRGRAGGGAAALRAHAGGRPNADPRAVAR